MGRPKGDLQGKIWSPIFKLGRLDLSRYFYCNRSGANIKHNNIEQQQVPVIIQVYSFDSK